ncbi:hypothetical protein [Brevundimonas sp.]|uniref:hypothetical protein n=1 Tax=Brevundimonas sp. TaxID=1871086 RepID=UPI002BB36450|nr:hypothetical protein [Brevundimonas sp.]HWQ85724.1 hypothetical protein [Brevundimonas sp.]
MNHALRHICIGLCVALLAAMNLHGLSQSRHDFAHAAEWPAVALVESEHDPHPAHVHLAPEEVPDTDTDNRDGDEPIPVGHHHHHGGSDVQAAMPSSGRVLTDRPSSASALRRPGLDPALASHTGDGPEHPPKRMRTVV